MRTNRKKGFTITELVIVIAVIAVLAAVLIPTFASVVSSANESKAMQNCHNALTTYRASEGGGDVDPGMVLLNNEDDNMYAYVYLGGSLEKIDKIDKIAYFDGKNAIDSKKKNEVESDGKIEFKFGDEGTGNYDETKKIAWEVKEVTKDAEGNATDGKTIKGGSFCLEAEHGDVASTDVIEDIPDDLSGTEHNDLTLYFYTIEVNDKNYIGWFTLESDKKDALLTLEEGAVLYSNNFGYIEDNGESKIVFSDGDKIDGEGAPAPTAAV